MQTFIRRSVAAWVAAMVLVSTVSGQDKIGSAYIPSDAIVTAVLSVSDTMDSPAAELYPTEIADAWFEQNVGMPASDIEQVKVVVGMPGPGEPKVGIVFTLKSALRVSELSPQIVNTEQPMDVEGVQVFPVNGPPGMVMHIKDANTVIVASQSYLGSILQAADAAPAGSLATLAASVPHTATITTVVAIEPLRPMINGMVQMQAEQIPPPLMEFTKIPNLLDALLLRVDLQNPDDGFRAVMLAGDESQADELLEIIMNGMQMGRQIMLSQMSAELDPGDPVAAATGKYMERISDHYVKALTPEKNGRRLTIRAEGYQSMATQGVLVGLLLPAVQSARQAARRMSSSNNMKQIGLAIHNYHSAYKKLPADITDEDGNPLLSWRVAILPFMEEFELYQQFKLDEPWDSPNNKPLMEMMPEVYSHPGMLTAPLTTVYQRPSGEGMMGAGSKLRFRDVLDGLSNTIMGVETAAGDAVAWTKPADIELTGDNPLSQLDDGTRQGFNVLMADGAVIFMDVNVDPSALKAMLTRAGREVINPGGFR